MKPRERLAWHRQLSGWYDPVDFTRAVDACDDDSGIDGPLTQHGLGFWRDAWIAAQHATLTNADGVRLLHPKQHPDYALLIGGSEFEFEATEAMRPERRRGDEFRADAILVAQGLPAVRCDPVENWLTPALASSILKTRSDAKALKPYANQCGLVIYLNETSYGANEQDIKGTFATATEGAGKVFQSVDVLWKSQIHHVWRAGAIS